MAVALQHLRPACNLAQVIETQGLSKTYPGGVRAVDSLDLTIESGEIFGVGIDGFTRRVLS